MKKRDISKDSLVEIKSLSEDIQVTLLKEENLKLNVEMLSLKKEISQLKKTKIDKIIVTDETVIAEIQLRLLKEKAMMGELTLEEIKKYDLLVKNKKLSEGSPTVIADYKKLPDNIKEEDLILLASSQNLENDIE